MPLASQFSQVSLFVTCKCGAVSVDGGHNYIRRCADSLEDFEDLSEYEEDLTIADAIRQFVEQSGDKYSIYENYSGRGMFGRKCLGVVLLSLVSRRVS